MKTYTKRELLVTVVYTAATGYLSVSKFLKGDKIDALLWLIAMCAFLIKDLRRYWKRSK